MRAVDVEQVDATIDKMVDRFAEKHGFLIPKNWSSASWLRVDTDRRGSIVARARHICAPREAIFRFRRSWFHW